MTVFSKYLGEHGPFDPLATPTALDYVATKAFNENDSQQYHETNLFSL